MSYFRPTNLSEALEIKSEYPDAMPVSGGTDIMVPINSGTLNPRSLMDISSIPELSGITSTKSNEIRIGAGVTFAQIITECSKDLPALGMAAVTVGSPQIRNRATLGGNLAMASPAGDSLPVLVAVGAKVELASRGRRRMMLVADFLTGPKQTAIGQDELIVAVHVPQAAGPQVFSKVGTRNAMVISVASFALELQPKRRKIRCAIGSAGPVVARAEVAEELAAELEWPSEGLSAPKLNPRIVQKFGCAVRDAARPISDVRGTSKYRNHVLEVLARRNLLWAWQSLTGSSSCK